MKSNTVILSALLGLFLVLSSCRGSSPMIDELNWRLIYRDDGAHRYEELSLFLRVSDPDGSGDPALITVSAGNTGLIWQFPESEWITGSGGGKEWIGLPSLVPLSGFRLPDAVYTVRLEDLAGHGYEMTFRPDPDRPVENDLVWPEVSVTGGVLLLEGDWSEALLILRDENRGFRESMIIRDGDDLNTRGAEVWELWIAGVNDGTAYRLGPYLSSDSE